MRRGCRWTTRAACHAARPRGRSPSQQLGARWSCRRSCLTAISGENSPEGQPTIPTCSLSSIGKGKPSPTRSMKVKRQEQTGVQYGFDLPAFCLWGPICLVLADSCFLTQGIWPIAQLRSYQGIWLNSIEGLFCLLRTRTKSNCSPQTKNGLTRQGTVRVEIRLMKSRMKNSKYKRPSEAVLHDPP